MSEDDGPWYSALVECRVCRHRWAAVGPLPTEGLDGVHDLECPNCGNMAGDPAEESEENT